MKWVGTNCTWVTRCSSIAASTPSASKRSMTTTVPPARWVASDHAIGAAWYSGAGQR